MLIYSDKDAPNYTTYRDTCRPAPMSLRYYLRRHVNLQLQLHNPALPCIAIVLGIDQATGTGKTTGSDTG